MNVFKFGGASVKDADSIRNVARIILANDKPLVIVISAMGKTTNAIEEVIRLAKESKGDAIEAWNEVCHRHKRVSTELNATKESLKYLDEYQMEGREVIDEYSMDNSDEFYDQLICRGELMSTTIVTAYLLSQDMPAKWLDARKMLKSDERFRSANIQWRETESATKEMVADHASRYKYLVTQGFIASTRDGRTTTLGREGSDYTAAIISYCIGAEKMTIWKDVPGVLTGDPRIFPDANLVEKMSYREAIEMTYYGAQVIHPKTIQPIQRKEIPLHVKSFIDPNSIGTLIDNTGAESYPPMIVVTKNQYLLRFGTKDFSFIAERHLSMLFRKFNHYRIRVNLMRNTAISFTVSATAERVRLNLLKEDLMYDFTIDEKEGMDLITIRHYTDEIISELKENRVVLFEEVQGETFQMVLKKVEKDE
ncbi:aspartate kinase [Saprospiraceae bacterium]|nr:aspartate kinase [Saprospiraceae bacterium]